MRGSRKLLFGLLGLLFLTFALALCLRNGEAGKVLFPSFAAAVVGIVTVVVAGNVGAHVAQARAATAAGLTSEELEKRVAAALSAKDEQP